MKEEMKKETKLPNKNPEEKKLEEGKKTKKVKEKINKESQDDSIIGDIISKEEIMEITEPKPKKRLTRQEEEREEAIKSWRPKTNLGRKVQSGEIKNIDEILDKGERILEEEIVDILLKPKTDLISIGQAKGKFGGGKRRAWRQTQRIKKEGGVLTFSAMAIVGDENGHIGIGFGKANETLPARDKATRKAKLNVIRIKRACSAFDCSCDELHSIPFEVQGKSGSVRIKLIPAPQGTGLVVASELKKILKMAGIKDVYSRTEGNVQTTFNLVKACVDALSKTKQGVSK